MGFGGASGTSVGRIVLKALELDQALLILQREDAAALVRKLSW